MYRHCNKLYATASGCKEGIPESDVPILTQSIEGICVDLCMHKTALPVPHQTLFANPDTNAAATESILGALRTAGSVIVDLLITAYKAAAKQLKKLRIKLTINLKKQKKKIAFLEKIVPELTEQYFPDGGIIDDSTLQNTLGQFSATELASKLGELLGALSDVSSKIPTRDHEDEANLVLDASASRLQSPNIRYIAEEDEVHTKHLVWDSFVKDSCAKLGIVDALRSDESDNQFHRRNSTLILNGRILSAQYKTDDYRQPGLAPGSSIIQQPHSPTEPAELPVMTQANMLVVLDTIQATNANVYTTIIGDFQKAMDSSENVFTVMQKLASSRNLVQTTIIDDHLDQLGDEINTYRALGPELVVDVMKTNDRLTKYIQVSAMMYSVPTRKLEG